MDCSWNLLYRPGKPFSGHRILCREVYCVVTIIIRQQRSFGGVAPSEFNHLFVRDCLLFLASPVVNVNEIQRCCIVRCVLHVVLCRVPLNDDVCSAWSCVVCQSSPSSRYSLSGVVNFHRDNSATACTVLLCAHVYQSCDGDNSDLRSPCVAVPFNCAVVPYIISVVGAEVARKSSE